MILIITNREDFTADHMIVRLRDRGLPYFRVNSEDLASTSVEFRPDVGLGLFSGGRELRTEQVRAVWFRRAIRPRVSEAIDGAARGFALGELRHFYEGTLSAIHAVWVNPIWATVLAERKMYQLSLASQVGFLVPQTLATNRLEEALRFVQEPSVAKPVFHGLWARPGRQQVAYTRRVTADDINESIRHCPTLLQRAIDKRSDIRVTVIGDQVFTAEILSDTEHSIDWRHPDQSTGYRTRDCPVDIQVMCQTLMARLRLRYGAFDFVEDARTGAWHFLEVNPAGEWAWLERELGWDLRDAFIDLFMETLE